MVLRERHSRQPGWTRRRFSTPFRLDTAWYSTYPVAISMVLWLLLPLVGHQAVADAKREFARPSATSMVVPADRYHRSRVYPTWLQNAVTTSWPHGWPAVAVVMDDLGLNSDSTTALNELPAPLTLAFLPYANALERQTRLARAAGHELLVHVPMEPIGHEWPGPKALTKALSQHELLTRLRAQLQRFRNFVGINNHNGLLAHVRPTTHGLGDEGAECA